ncbi:MAG TPA: outer membrane beta-barrel protein [Bacteroidia bacterium]|nr:outer membrane beta-barrel protein [Bacteroidia bacterium]
MLRKLMLLFCLCPLGVLAQEKEENPGAGRFMVGLRTTVSAFSDAGHFGFGSGAQVRIQFGPKVNSEWYYDHISTDIDGLGRRVDEHIGWSVMFYALGQHLEKGKFSPYVEAGNCFDYTGVKSNSSASSWVSRGSAAVHLGLGTHYNLSEKADITLKAQYMIHLGLDINETEQTNETTGVRYLDITKGNEGLNGHLLMTCSVNFYFGRLWKGYLFGKKSKNL